MDILVDLSVVPPAVSLADADNFQSFRVVVGRGSDATVDPNVVRSLARQVGALDDDWEESFESMISYARSKGWIDDDGRIKAHVEWDG